MTVNYFTHNLLWKLPASSLTHLTKSVYYSPTWKPQDWWFYIFNDYCHDWLICCWSTQCQKIVRIDFKTISQMKVDIFILLVRADRQSKTQKTLSLLKSKTSSKYSHLTSSNKWIVVIFAWKMNKMTRLSRLLSNFLPNRSILSAPVPVKVAWHQLSKALTSAETLNELTEN